MRADIAAYESYRDAYRAVAHLNGTLTAERDEAIAALAGHHSQHSACICPGCGMHPLDDGCPTCDVELPSPTWLERRAEALDAALAAAERVRALADTWADPTNAGCLDIMDCTETASIDLRRALDGE